MRSLALLCALLLAPAAAADLQLEAVADVQVVRPGLTSANVTVTLSLDCVQVLGRTGLGLTSQGVEVPVERVGNATVTWSGPASIVLPVAGCLDDEASADERVSVSADYIAGLSGDLPGRVVQASTVRATLAEAQEQAMPAETAEDTFGLEAAALPSLQVEAPKLLFDLEGPTAQVPMRLTNLGNVAITVEAVATLRNATVGGSFTMPRVEVARGASVDVVGTFQAPTGPWQRQTVLLDLTPVTQGGTERGNPQHVEMLFRSDQPDETSPPAASAWMVLVLLGAAVAARRSSP